jgi:glycosyltransferase involved in cell wall biosynthesis
VSPSTSSTLEQSERAGAPARTDARRVPLNICHLAYTFYEGDNRVIRYAKEMRSAGHNVDVIALRRLDQPMVGDVDGVRLIRIQRRSVTEKAAVVYLAKLLWFLTKATAVLTFLNAKRRYDVVHVHNVPDFLVFAAIVPKLTGARLILDIHDILPELFAGKFSAQSESRTFRALVRMERASCAFADRVIVANDLWHDTLERRSGKPCVTMLNYPDISVFKPLPASARRSDGRFVFLYPGSLNHHQGVDIALRAFARVKNDMPSAEFHIYGDGPAKPLLIDMVRELELGDRVKICERVSIATMAGILAGADVGIVPKRADGFGNEAFSTKIFEFMACGVPVIISRTRVDEHHFNASLVRFFTSGDDAELATAMLEAYRDRRGFQIRAQAAQKFAIAQSWQQRGGEYRAIIDAIVDRPRGLALS